MSWPLVRHLQYMQFQKLQLSSYILLVCLIKLHIYYTKIRFVNTHSSLKNRVLSGLHAAESVSGPQQKSVTSSASGEWRLVKTLYTELFLLFISLS